MEKVVTLSDGESCAVTVLGLFDLDDIGPDIPQDYHYDITLLTGITVSVPYPLDKLTQPPPKPKTDPTLLVEGSVEWEEQREWDTYHAAMLRRAEQVDAREQWTFNAAGFIVRHCLQEDDRRRLVEEDDWSVVYAAALAPKVGLDDLEQALEKTYGASFSGRPVLDALMEGEGGDTTLDVLRYWEVQTLDKLGIWRQEDVDQWLDLPVKERAARIVGASLGDWMKALDIDKAIRESKRG